MGLDVPATARAIAAAAFAPTGRTAALAVSTTQPGRTTREAKAMGITGVVGSYTTTYGGTPGRLHNVQLVSQLIDDTLIAPGNIFSFNRTTGERTPEKGFQSAPVIINGELQNGIGGGICQVSTTVFNTAYEAGLSIEERTNHALYISHYPLGRDATVNYPDLDLKFKNDTGRWLLLRTFVGPGSLTVNLYGTPQDRRVESSAGPLVVTGAVPVKTVKDPNLLKGKRVVDVSGVPPRSTSVHRVVYGPDGKVMYDSVVGLPLRRRDERRPRRHETATEEEAEAGGGRSNREAAGRGASQPQPSPGPAVSDSLARIRERTLCRRRSLDTATAGTRVGR